MSSPENHPAPPPESQEHVSPIPSVPIAPLQPDLQYATNIRRLSSQALVAAILGFCSIPLNIVCFMGIPAGFVAFYFGIAASANIKYDLHLYGRPLAIFGMVTGALGMLCPIPILALWPHLGP